MCTVCSKNFPFTKFCVYSTWSLCQEIANTENRKQAILGANATLCLLIQIPVCFCFSHPLVGLGFDRNFFLLTTIGTSASSSLLMPSLVPKLLLRSINIVFLGPAATLVEKTPEHRPSTSLMLESFGESDSNQSEYFHESIIKCPQKNVYNLTTAKVQS